MIRHPRTGVQSRREARARELDAAATRARIYWLTDIIVNGVWEKSLTPVEIAHFQAELAILTGHAEYV